MNQLSARARTPSKKLRILLINDVGYLEGGITAMILYTQRALKAAGHDVRIFTSDLYSEKKLFSDYTFPATNPRSPLRVFKYLYNWTACHAARKAIADFKPDVVHVHYYDYQLSPSIFRAIKDMPSVLTVHSHEIICPRGTLRTPAMKPCTCSVRGPCLACTGVVRYVPGYIRAKILQHELQYVDQIITPSDFQCHLVRAWGYSTAKTVRNGIATQPRKALPTKGHHILFVGRLEKVKGVHVLLDAFLIVRNALPDATLTIVGSGSETKALQQQAQTLGIASAVHFHSWMPLAQVREAYAAAHVAVVPSIYPDCYPTVIIEAMSVGRTVIGSRTGGIPELIDDKETGLLVTPGKTAELARALITVLSSQKKQAAMGRAGHAKAAALTIERHVEALTQTYRNTIAQHAAERDEPSS